MKEWARLWFSEFYSLYFWIANWKAKDAPPNDRKYSLSSVCS
jgi:hypothetical protein